MINEKQAKLFCAEDISLIENYQEAVNDTTQTWDCHHRRECVDGVYTSVDELKEKGLYYKRPANELIFLTRSEHRKIHEKDPAKIKKNSESHKGKRHSLETKINIGEARLGKHHSEEAKEKNRQKHLGKKHSEEAKIKMSEARKGKKLGPHSDERKKHISEAIKGRHYWNNGLVCKMCKECPGPDFIPGRIKKKCASN